MSFSSQVRCSCFLMISMTLFWACSSMFMSFLYCAPQHWTHYSWWGSHQSKVKGENHLSWVIGNTSLDTDLDTVGFLEGKHTHCWSTSHFSSTSTPKSSSSGLFSLIPQSVLILEIVLIKVQGLSFCLGGLHCGSHGPTPIPQSASGRHSFSQANPPLIFMLSTNLLRVHLISLSM